MKLRDRLWYALLSASYASESRYRLLNFAMLDISMRNSEHKYRSTADRDAVLRELGFDSVGTRFFRGKSTISRVMDSRGKHFILKTGGIDPFQIPLLRAARHLEHQLAFRVPAIVNQGNGWILLEEIAGKSLNALCDSDPDQYVAISKRVADSYSVLLQSPELENSFGDLLADGKSWLLSRLNLWSKPIVDAGLIEFSLVQRLEKEFERVISEKGERFFDWAHGNIIGDHIILSGGDVYLLDLNVVPRAGRGYHDFLRALDFLLLKAEDLEYMSERIPIWIRQYLSEFDESEIRLVLAFRMIGILGWDILHCSVEYARGDISEKIELILKFICREW